MQMTPIRGMVRVLAPLHVCLLLGVLCVLLADPNLTEQFVWGKKVERERKLHGDAGDASAEALKRRRADQLRELEKAKQARVQREQEREAWEAERVMLEREREQMAFADNEKREEEFQLRQTHLRARIRAGEGRGKPIDLLSESLYLVHEDADPGRAHEIKPQVSADAPGPCMHLHGAPINTCCSHQSHCGRFVPCRIRWRCSTI